MILGESLIQFSVLTYFESQICSKSNFLLFQFKYFGF